MRRDPLLERDHADAVHDRLRRIAVREAPDAEVAQIEADPDHELEPKIGPSAGKDAPAGCNDCGHAGILNTRVAATKMVVQPPM